MTNQPNIAHLPHGLAIGLGKPKHLEIRVSIVKAVVRNHGVHGLDRLPAPIAKRVLRRKLPRNARRAGGASARARKVAPVLLPVRASNGQRRIAAGEKVGGRKQHPALLRAVGAEECLPVPAAVRGGEYRQPPVGLDKRVVAICSAVQVVLVERRIVKRVYVHRIVGSVKQWVTVALLPATEIDIVVWQRVAWGARIKGDDSGEFDFREMRNSGANHVPMRSFRFRAFRGQPAANGSMRIGRSAMSTHTSLTIQSTMLDDAVQVAGATIPRTTLISAAATNASENGRRQFDIFPCNYNA